MEQFTVSSAGDLDECLQENGIAILPGVLQPGECEALKASLWEGLGYITSRWEKPLRRGDLSSWVGLHDLDPTCSQRLQHWQVGHLQAAWNVRQHPRVQAAFATLWGVPPTELLCSIDGISVHLPPELTGRGYGESKLHCDQAFTRPERDAVQGWVNANAISEGDATFTFLRRSHRFTEAAAERFPSLCTDRCPLSSEMIRFYASECGSELHRITCPAGSLVLWDSRTVHGMCGSVRGAEPAEMYLIYVCMTPRAKATVASLSKLRTAFYEMRMTGHSPHRPELRPRQPRRSGLALPLMADMYPPHVQQHYLVGAAQSPLQGGEMAAVGKT
jgi:hypothetical protein